jgi:hypothetical protein
MFEQRWSRADKFGFWTVVGTFLGIIVAVYVPEIRCWVLNSCTSREPPPSYPTPTTTGTPRPITTSTPIPDPTPDPTPKKRANINSVWSEKDVWEEGTKGMLIHTNFDVFNLQGETIQLIAFFYLKEGDETPIKNPDASCATDDAAVCAAHFFVPNDPSETFKDRKVFIPYGDLHFPEPGPRNLKYHVDIREKGATEVLAQSDWQAFTFTQPVTLDKIWEKGNVFQPVASRGRKKGLVIHLRFQTDDLLGEKMEAIAFFRYRNSEGTPVKNIFAQCIASDDEVCAFQTFTPPYRSATYKDLQLFLPLEDLSLQGSGHWSLKYQVLIRPLNSARAFVTSNWRNFDFSRP